MPENDTLSPRLRDYSRKAIRKEVLREGLTHWLTLYPSAIGIPLGLAAFLFNLPLLYFGMITTLSVSLISAIIHIFFREDTIAARYLERLARRLKEEEQVTLENLGNELHACRNNNNAGTSYGKQADEQFTRLQQKYQNVQAVLNKKLDQGELTYGRFIGASEQVYLSGLENLKQTVTIMQSLGSIDPEYISSRLAQLEKMESSGPAEVKEREALLKRLQLREEQLNKVNMLLTGNEEAMTSLEETTAAIAAMDTDGAITGVDYESAIEQLQEIAGKAYLYNRK